MKFKVYNSDKDKMFGPYTLQEYVTGIAKDVADFAVKYDKIFSHTKDTEFNTLRYTEVNDCNGKEIYEGDEIEYTEFQETFSGEVYFQNGAFWIGLDNGSIRLLSNINTDWIEVVGNKYKSHTRG